jgi:hypothetical protein
MRAPQLALAASHGGTTPSAAELPGHGTGGNGGALRVRNWTGARHMPPGTARTRLDSATIRSGPPPPRHLPILVDIRAAETSPRSQGSRPSPHRGRAKMISHAGRPVAGGRDSGRRRRGVLFRRDAGALGCPRDIDRPGTAHGNDSRATACFLRGCAFTNASRSRCPQAWKVACVMPRWCCSALRQWIPKRPPAKCSHSFLRKPLS